MTDRHRRTKSTRWALAVLALLAVATPARAQSAADSRLSQQASNSPPEPGEPGNTRVGLLLFAGFGRSDFGDATTDLIPKVVARYQAQGLTDVTAKIQRQPSLSGGVGGAVLIESRGMLGANVGYRLHTGGGPRLVASADRTSAPALHSQADSTLDWHFSVLSFGASINAGDLLLVEPMIDLDFVTITTSTREQSTGVADTTSIVERSSRNAGWGVRMTGFLTHSVGIGVEYHRVRPRDITPGLAVAPWQQDFRVNQLFIAVYYRLMQ